MPENDKGQTPFYTDAEKAQAKQTAKDNLARTEAAETDHKQQLRDKQDKKK